MKSSKISCTFTLFFLYASYLYSMETLDTNQFNATPEEIEKFKQETRQKKLNTTFKTELEKSDPDQIKITQLINIGAQFTEKIDPPNSSFCWLIENKKFSTLLLLYQGFPLIKESPTHISLLFQHTKPKDARSVIQLLDDLTIDITQITLKEPHEGNTLLDIAIQHNNLLIIEYLIEKKCKTGNTHFKILSKEYPSSLVYLMFEQPRLAQHIITQNLYLHRPALHMIGMCNGTNTYTIPFTPQKLESYQKCLITLLQNAGESSLELETLFDYWGAKKPRDIGYAGRFCETATTALHEAVIKNWYAVAQVLIQKGTPIKDNCYGISPFDIAVSHLNIPMIQLLWPYSTVRFITIQPLLSKCLRAIRICMVGIFIVSTFIIFAKSNMSK